MRLTAALLATALTGCGSMSVAKVGVGTGLVVTAVGLVMLNSDPSHNGPDPSDSAWVPLVIGGSILVLSLIALRLGAEEERTVTPSAPPPDPEKAKRAADREQAWQLTKSAAEAARAGDCTAATSADPTVHALDADFHATVFLRDAAIARCLAPAPTGSPAPAG